jgi:hypothetical protein
LNNWLLPVRPAKQGEKDAKTKELKKGVRKKMEAGVQAAANVIKRRADYSLDLPYGPNAAALGLGEQTPPSHRSSGDPPGT